MQVQTAANLVDGMIIKKISSITQMCLKAKNRGKTKFYRNEFLTTLGSTFQEGPN
jgi:hypothetical protein